MGTPGDYQTVSSFNTGEIRHRKVDSFNEIIFLFIIPDMIEAEEEVMLDILAGNNMLIDRKS